jgi:uncharacterized protein YndB with AHSA1/START domain
MSDLRLTSSPSVDVGVLIRRPPHPVFEALGDPAVTTRFWYTKSSGRMEHGAQLTWEWEMYNVSSKVIVDEVDPDDASASPGTATTPPTRRASSFTSCHTATTPPTSVSLRPGHWRW